MEIGGVKLVGPHEEKDLEDRPGVYVVLDETGRDGKLYHTPVYVGEAERMHIEVYDNPERECWEENSDGMIVFAVLYMDGRNVAHRRRVAAEVGAACHNLPCIDL